MCGISGVAGFNNVSAMLVDTIKQLEYRGYDSCGIGFIDKSGNIGIRKNIGGVEEVSRKERFIGAEGKVGIAHTRWATHGRVTPENTHPHFSCDKNFSLVHNGIISNYIELRSRLKKQGHKFVSETDTEVIVHLIEDEYKKYNDTEQAFIKALRHLDGTYAVVLISRHEPEKIFCARLESPLLIGVGDNENFVGSDATAFISYTKDTIILDDFEYAVVTKDRYIIRNFISGEELDKEIVTLQWDAEMTKKGGYPHYMLKEIYEQPDVVKRALNLNISGIEEIAQMIVNSDRVYLTGVGTTYYVSQFGEYQFSKISGMFTPAISSDEFKNLAQIDENSMVLALSQSGETYDTLSALKFAKKQGAKTAAIVNVVGSSMSRLVDKIVLQGSGPEICVISTKAALAQMIVLITVALEVAKLRGRITTEDQQKAKSDLSELPGAIQNILNETSGLINKVAKKYSKINNWLYLGRGQYYPIALESALKMKEVAYVHAEGMPAGFLKHGTLALIDENLYSVFFVPHPNESELFRGTMSSAEEIKARDGFIFGFHFGGIGNEKIFDEEIVLPNTSPLIAPFLQMIVAQLFSYFTANDLKRNIDKPRSLAKSVTVG